MGRKNKKKRHLKVNNNNDNNKNNKSNESIIDHKKIKINNDNNDTQMNDNDNNDTQMNDSDTHIKNNDNHIDINGESVKEDVDIDIPLIFTKEMNKINSKTIYRNDKVEEQGKNFFEWMIAPMKSEEFYAKYQEKCPLLIQRNSIHVNKKQKENESYYHGWYGSEDIIKMLNNHEIKFGRDLNVTQYINEERKTLDKKDQIVTEYEVRNYLKDGCSIRILCPQKFNHRIWTMLTLLDEFWAMGSGCNVYWTPAGTQGFAPHYDDIDAYILQVEGSKHWRLYPFRSVSEELDRDPSPNLKQDELGEPIIDTILHPGDFLYVPRGMIHQADSLKSADSLHITVSTGHKHTYEDWLNIALGVALKSASAENSAFRRSLPHQYMNYMGVAKADLEDSRREQFMNNIMTLLQCMSDYIPYDAASDAMTSQYLHDCVPPSTSVNSFLSKEQLNGKVPTLNDYVRMLRPRIFNLSVEDEGLIVYHKASNSRLYHDKPPQSILFDISFGPALETILNSFPQYVQISELPDLEDEDRLDLVKLLADEKLIAWKRG